MAGMPPAGPRLRVMTMNAYGPANPDWDRRHRLLGDTIRDLDPDVVALQEVPVDPDGDLARILGPGYQLAPFSRSADGVGGTVATRSPHRVVTEIDLHLNQRARETLPWSAAVVLEVET